MSTDPTPDDDRPDGTRTGATALEDALDDAHRDSARGDAAGSDTADGPGGTVPGAAAAPAPAPRRSGPRVGTVVWGLVIAAIGVGLLAAASGAQIDVQLAVIVLVAASGVALLVGSLLTGARERRSQAGGGTGG